MKRVPWQFMLAVFVGLALVVSACSSNVSSGGLPETLDKSIKGQAPEGSEIISVQQASKAPDDSDTIKPENVWCVVTESNGTKACWLGFYLPPEDEESAGMAMVTQGPEETSSPSSAAPTGRESSRSEGQDGSLKPQARETADFARHGTKSGGGDSLCSIGA